MPKLSRRAKVRRMQALIDGTRRHLGGQPRWMIASKEYTPDEIVARLQRFVDRLRASDAAYASWTARLLEERREEASLRSFVAVYDRMVHTMFSESPDILASFGLKPYKEGKKTLEVVVQQIAQAKATREARATMGKRQKAKIKGVVPAKPDPKKKKKK